RVDLVVDVRSGEHRHHARHAQCRARVDAGDPGMRVRAAHEVRVEHPDRRQIADVRPVPGDKPWVFHSLDRGSDESSPSHWRLPVPEKNLLAGGHRSTQRFGRDSGRAVYSVWSVFQLTLRGVSKAYGRRVVFEDVSLTIRPGEHVGVVGDNGAGKSTLLRLMAGSERPDAGEVLLHADGGVGSLDQTLELPSTTTVGQTIDQALASLRESEREL